MMYREIWETIKVNQKAEITISKERADTVIQGVKRTKCVDNAHRSSVGLIPFSKLVITQELISEKYGMLKVTFQLLYDTRI